MLFRKDILICFIVGVALLSSCKNPNKKEAPSGIIEKTVFTEMLLNMQLVEAHLNEVRIEQVYIRDSANNYFKEIFEKYNYSRELFKKTMDYYATQPGELQGIYETVLDKLSGMEADLVDVKIDQDIMNAVGKHDLAIFIAGLPISNMFFDSTLSDIQIKDSLFKYLIDTPTYFDSLNANVASFQKSYVGLTYKKPMYISLREEIKAIVIKNKGL